MRTWSVSKAGMRKATRSGSIEMTASMTMAGGQ